MHRQDNDPSFKGVCTPISRFVCNIKIINVKGRIKVDSYLQLRWEVIISVSDGHNVITRINLRVEVEDSREDKHQREI